MPALQAPAGDVVAEAQRAAALAGEAFAMASKAQQLLDGVARTSMAGAAAGSPTAYGQGLGGGSPAHMYPVPPPAAGMQQGGQGAGIAQVTAQQLFTGQCNVSFSR